MSAARAGHQLPPDQHGSGLPGAPGGLHLAILELVAEVSMSGTDSSLGRMRASHHFRAQIQNLHDAPRREVSCPRRPASIGGEKDGKPLLRLQPRVCGHHQPR